MEIDSHIACAMSGLTADAPTLVEHGRVETQVRVWCTALSLVIVNFFFLHLFEKMPLSLLARWKLKRDDLILSREQRRTIDSRTMNLWALSRQLKRYVTWPCASVRAMKTPWCVLDDQFFYVILLFLSVRRHLSWIIGSVVFLQLT